MKTLSKTKKIVGTTAVAAGLVFGAAGIANAASGPDVTSQTDPVENDANEANETPEQEAAEDAAELELLNSFPVSPDDASAAALAVVPGTVDEVEISEDAASPVFEVEIVDANGQEIIVTVDPNSGAVIDQMVEGPDDDANEANEGPEANEAPEATEAPATK